MYLKTFNSLRFKMCLCQFYYHLYKASIRLRFCSKIHPCCDSNQFTHTCIRTLKHTKSTTTFLCINSNRGVFCALWPPTSHQIRALAGYCDYVARRWDFFSSVVTLINCITLVGNCYYLNFSQTTKITIATTLKKSC